MTAPFFSPACERWLLSHTCRPLLAPSAKIVEWGRRTHNQLEFIEASMLRCAALPCAALRCAVLPCRCRDMLPCAVSAVPDVHACIHWSCHPLCPHNSYRCSRSHLPRLLNCPAVQEAAMLRRLRHPNIVSFQAICITGGLGRACGELDVVVLDSLGGRSFRCASHRETN